MKNQQLYKSLILLAFCALTLTANAQYKVKQVLIANGGVFFGPANKITIGSYDPGPKKYTLFDSVTGNSVTQIITNGNIAFMATDSYLVSYNLDNLKRLNIAKVTGLRHIALYKNMIAAAVGSDPAGTHFKLFKQSDLSLVYAETKISVYSDGIAIAGDSAFIAMEGDYPNYNDTGKIAVEDLVNHKLARIIKLDTASRGISSIFSNSTKVIGVTEYPYARISELDIKTGSLKIISSPVYTPFALINDSLFGDISGNIGDVILPGGSTQLHGKLKGFGYAAAQLDTIHKLFYYTGASFSKPAKAYIANYSGTLLDSFPIGISPEGIAIDYRLKSGIDKSNETSLEMQLFPNPANSVINILCETGQETEITVSDLAGKIQYAAKFEKAVQIPVNGLSKGMYIVTLKNEQGMITKKFIKN